MNNQNLHKYDYKIIKYISKYDQISIHDILKKFPDKKYSTTKRINDLSSIYSLQAGLSINYSYIEHIQEYLGKGSLGAEITKPTNFYRITDIGRIELQNYLSKTRENNIKDFIRSFFFPMLIAAITALLTTYLTYSYLIK